MKLISMADDKKSFQICAISGTKKFNIAEMLFLKQGEYSDYSGRKYSYVEYKIKVCRSLINNVSTAAPALPDLPTWLLCLPGIAHNRKSSELLPYKV